MGKIKNDNLLLNIITLLSIPIYWLGTLFIISSALHNLGLVSISAFGHEKDFGFGIFELIFSVSLVSFAIQAHNHLREPVLSDINEEK